MAVAQRVEPDVELGAVPVERGQLLLGQLVDVATVGGDVVVGCRQRAVAPADRAPGQPQAVERLGAGHLVEQVQVDEQ